MSRPSGSGVVPTACAAFGALVWADILAFRRTWRAVIWTLAVPVLIVVLGASQVPHRLEDTATPMFEIAAAAMSTGMFALGLFGHAQSLASARERGVLDLIRACPVSPALILLSRFFVQFAAMILQFAVVMVVVAALYRVSAGAGDLARTLVAVALGGISALALGQLVVALTARAQSALAVARFLLVAVFLLDGFFLNVHRWPAALQTLARWSPVQLVQRTVAAGLGVGPWTGTDWAYLAGLLGWAGVMGIVGIVRFRWDEA